MKITSPNYTEAVQQTKQNQTQTDLGFSDILKEAQGTAKAATSAPMASAALNQNLLVGQILTSQSVGDPSVKTEQQLEKTLGKIDSYAQALGDENVSLRELAPLAQDLEKSAKDLANFSKDLPENSPLKDISKETAVLATVEAMKFKRGDYL